jgi:hypothetical protein
MRQIEEIASELAKIFVKCWANKRDMVYAIGSACALMDIPESMAYELIYLFNIKICELDGILKENYRNKEYEEIVQKCYHSPSFKKQSLEDLRRKMASLPLEMSYRDIKRCFSLISELKGEDPNERGGD